MAATGMAMIGDRRAPAWSLLDVARVWESTPSLPRGGGPAFGPPLSTLFQRIRACETDAGGRRRATVIQLHAHVAGVEQLDAVGIATKLVELVVIGLVLVGSTHHVGSRGRWLRELVSHKANGGLLR